MPHVSKRRIPENTKTLLEDALVYIFSGLTPTEVQKIFSILLTKTEQTMLAKRLGIAYFLNEGVDETRVAEAVKTTRQTVARIRLQLQAGSQEAYEFLLKKLSFWKQITTLKKVLKEAAIAVARKLIRGARGVP